MRVSRRSGAGSRCSWPPRCMDRSSCCLPVRVGKAEGSRGTKPWSACASRGRRGRCRPGRRRRWNRAPGMRRRWQSRRRGLGSAPRRAEGSRRGKARDSSRCRRRMGGSGAVARGGAQLPARPVRSGNQRTPATAGPPATPADARQLAGRALARTGAAHRLRRARRRHARRQRDPGRRWPWSRSATADGRRSQQRDPAPVDEAAWLRTLAAPATVVLSTGPSDPHPATSACAAPRAGRKAPAARHPGTHAARAAARRTAAAACGNGRRGAASGR